MISIDKRQERLAKRAAQKRLRMAAMSPEDKILMHNKDAAQKRLRIAAMSSEDKLIMRNKDAEQKFLRIAAMCPEDKKIMRSKDAEQKRLRIAAMSADDELIMRNKNAEQRRLRFEAMSDEDKQMYRCIHKDAEWLRVQELDWNKRNEILDKRVLAYSRSPKQLQQRGEEEETMMMFENDKPWLLLDKRTWRDYDNFYMNNINWYWDRLRDKSKSEARAYKSRVLSANITHRRKTEARSIRCDMFRFKAWEQQRLNEKNAASTVTFDPVV